MDLSLAYSPNLQTFDLAVSGADLAREDALGSAVLVALLSDRLVQPYEVAEGESRRGWWADAYRSQADGHLTGSRLWTLAREKQLPGTLLRCKQYCEEALQFFIDDGLAKSIVVAVFAPRMGWLVAMVTMALAAGSRNYRFEFDAATQRWRLAGEAF